MEACAKASCSDANHSNSMGRLYSIQSVTYLKRQFCKHIESTSFLRRKSSKLFFIDVNKKKPLSFNDRQAFTPLLQG